MTTSWCLLGNFGEKEIGTGINQSWVFWVYLLKKKNFVSKKIWLIIIHSIIFLNTFLLVSIKVWKVFLDNNKKIHPHAKIRILSLRFGSSHDLHFSCLLTWVFVTTTRYISEEYCLLYRSNAITSSGPTFSNSYTSLISFMYPFPLLYLDSLMIRFQITLKMSKFVLLNYFFLSASLPSWFTVTYMFSISYKRLLYFFFQSYALSV